MTGWKGTTCVDYFPPHHHPLCLPMQVLSQYEAYQNALGIRSLAFHRPPVALDAAGDVDVSGSTCFSSPLLAIGSYDGSVRLLSTHSWSVAFVFPATHPGDMMPALANGVATTVEVMETDDVATLTTGFDDSISLNDTIGSTYSTKYVRVNHPAIPHEDTRSQPSTHKDLHHNTYIPVIPFSYQYMYRRHVLQTIQEPDRQTRHSIHGQTSQVSAQAVFVCPGRQDRHGVSAVRSELAGLESGGESVGAAGGESTALLMGGCIRIFEYSSIRIYIRTGTALSTLFFCHRLIFQCP